VIRLIKKILALFLAICLIVPFIAACSTSPTTTTNVATTAPPTTTTSVPTTTSPATTTTAPTTKAKYQAKYFTDDLGRKVLVPFNITKVALSGPLTQIVLFGLCPDKLVGLAASWDSSAKEFLDEKYYNLPMLGQLYGGKGTLNLETIAASGAQVIIDVGETKANMAADMDNLQSQLNIPTIHIDAYTKGMGSAYRKLGDLLDMKEQANVLADYCDKVYDNTTSIMDKVGTDGKVKLLYITGAKGLNIIANGSYHAEVIDLLADNLAVVKNPSSSGTGNEVDLEQIMLWNPDVILFATGSIYSTVGSNKDWASISAIQNKKYYEVPYGPYNWMGFPPSVQRYLGMMWMAQLLYPDTANYNMYQEVAKYFKLFYHCDISEAQYNKLVTNSLGTK
jgi:iron complex transport system substrate-binding protein